MGMRFYWGQDCIKKNSSMCFGKQDQQTLEIIIRNTMHSSIIVMSGTIIFNDQGCLEKLLPGCANLVNARTRAVTRLVTRMYAR